MLVALETTLFCEHFDIKKGCRRMVYKTVSCSTQLNMIFILLKNVEVAFQHLKRVFWYFSFHEQLKFHAQLSSAGIFFITSGPDSTELTEEFRVTHLVLVNMRK